MGTWRAQGTAESCRQVSPGITQDWRYRRSSEPPLLRSGTLGLVSSRASITERNALIASIHAPQTCQLWPMPTVSKSDPHYLLSSLVVPRRLALQCTIKHPPSRCSQADLSSPAFVWECLLGSTWWRGQWMLLRFFLLCLRARELCAFLSMLNSIKKKLKKQRQDNLKQMWAQQAWDPSEHKHGHFIAIPKGFSGSLPSMSYILSFQGRQTIQAGTARHVFQINRFPQTIFAFVSPRTHILLLKKWEYLLVFVSHLSFKEFYAPCSTAWASHMEVFSTPQPSMTWSYRDKPWHCWMLYPKIPRRLL